MSSVLGWPTRAQRVVGHERAQRANKCHLCLAGRPERSEVSDMSRLYKPKAGFWIRLAVILIYPFDTIVFRIRWRHLDRIPPPSSGGVIVAVNHVSIVATVLMARVVWDAGRIPRFLVKSGAVSYTHL